LTIFAGLFGNYGPNTTQYEIATSLSALVMRSAAGFILLG
jgi:hypothetical protein